MHEDAPRSPDEIVLARAVEEGRILLTLDRDYEELIFHRGLPPPPEVVYFRLDPTRPDLPGLILLQLVADPNIDIGNLYTKIGQRNTTQRPLR